MSDQVGSVFIELTLNGEKYTTAIKKVEAEAVASGKKIQESLHPSTGLAEKGMDNLIGKFKQLGAAAAVYFSAGYIKNFVQESIAAASGEADALLKMELVLKNTGRAAALATADIEKFALALQRKTGFDQEDTYNAIVKLASYKKITDSMMKDVIGLAADMAAKSGGSITASAAQLGRALENPTQGMMLLRRAGVILDEQQKVQIKTFMGMNNIAGAQQVIIDKLKKSVNGLAEEMNKTYSGQQKVAMKEWGEVLEEVGTAFTTNPDVIGFWTELQKVFKDLAGWIAVNRKEIADFISEAYKGALTAIKAIIELGKGLVEFAKDYAGVFDILSLPLVVLGILGKALVGVIKFMHDWEIAIKAVAIAIVIMNIPAFVTALTAASSGLAIMAGVQAAAAVGIGYFGIAMAAILSPLGLAAIAIGTLYASYKFLTAGAKEAEEEMDEFIKTLGTLPKAALEAKLAGLQVVAIEISKMKVKGGWIPGVATEEDYKRNNGFMMMQVKEQLNIIKYGEEEEKKIKKASEKNELNAAQRQRAAAQMAWEINFEKTKNDALNSETLDQIVFQSKIRKDAGVSEIDNAKIVLNEELKALQANKAKEIDIIEQTVKNEDAKAKITDGSKYNAKQQLENKMDELEEKHRSQKLAINNKYRDADQVNQSIREKESVENRKLLLNDEIESLQQQQSIRVAMMTAEGKSELAIGKENYNNAKELAENKYKNEMDLLKESISKKKAISGITAETEREYFEASLKLYQNKNKAIEKAETDLTKVMINENSIRRKLEKANINKAYLTETTTSEQATTPGTATNKAIEDAIRAQVAIEEAAYSAANGVDLIEKQTTINLTAELANRLTIWAKYWDAIGEEGKAAAAINGRDTILQYLEIQKEQLATAKEAATKKFDTEKVIVIRMANEMSKLLMEQANKRAEAGDASGAQEREIKAIQETAKAQKLLTTDKVELANIEQEAINKTRLVDQKYFAQKMNNFSNVVQGFGSVIDSMMDMYDKDSSEYKRLSEWKKGIQIAEIALKMVQNAQIIASNLGLIASNSSVAVTSAGAAVTGAAIGVGPMGFATAAAMIALLAGVFSAYGIVAGGGGAPSVAAPAALPASTVLGAEAGTPSESISKSFELLKDTYSMENTKLTKIYNELRDLNNNITGLVTNIVRTGGVGVTADLVNLEATKGENMMLKLSPLLVPSKINMVTDPFSFFMNIVTGALLGEKFEDFMSGVLGGSITSQQYAGGVIFGGASNAALQAGGSMGGQNYGSIVQQTDGGWFGSDSWMTYNVYSAMTAEVSSMFDLVFKDMGATLIGLAEGLGTDVDAALNYVFAATGVNLMGMGTEAINETLTAWLSGIMDIAVDTLFGDVLEGYQQLNEGLMETAVRILTQQAVVQTVLEKTGQEYSGTTAEWLKFADDMITIAGDMEAFTDAMEIYYDAFHTDMEKQADLKSMMTSYMESMDMVLPDSRGGYRSLIGGIDLTLLSGADQYKNAMAAYDATKVEGGLFGTDGDQSLLAFADAIDQTTVSGQEAYVALLQLSEYAGAYYDYLEELASQKADMEIQIMELEGNASGALAAQRAIELAALEDSLKPLQERIWLLQDEAAAAEAWKSAVSANLSLAESNLRASFDAEKQRLTDEFNAAQEALATSYATQIDTINASLDTASQLVSDLQANVDKLRSAKERMRIEDTVYIKNEYALAQAKLASVLVQARQGDLTGINDLDTTLETLTGSSTDLYSTFVDYQKDYWKTYSAISELEDLAGNQLSIQEQTVALLEAQLQVIEDAKDLSTVLEIETISILDEQLNQLLGINTGVLSLEAAIAGWTAAQIAAAKINITTTDWGTETDRNKWLSAITGYTGQYGTTGNPEGTGIGASSSGFNLYSHQMGYDMEQLLNLYATMNPGYTGIGSPSNPYAGFAEGGISTGSETGYLATLHGTELIVSPRASFPATVRGGSNSINVVFIEELRALRAEIKAGNLQGNKNTGKMVKVLDRMDSTGVIISEVNNSNTRIILDTRAVA